MSKVELFVYYRLRAVDVDAARSAFEDARAGRPLRLLQRQDADPSLLTWMEIYPAAQVDAEPAVAAAMSAFVQGLRHREVFEPLLPG
ncbi:DUF4936 family protein [Roseateles sp. DAIF2]|uniref:DUF4936 family protein n=1 Tax=Roseateles sp. DAIF2 TaxID=2714952 RepID=UPI0018A3375F|nr:DUF4936 family protein [Roseateles sp. DAIF2]QPF73953.1 DUF4936 family protein [Roseateles sp. DAIF2]